MAFTIEAAVVSACALTLTLGIVVAAIHQYGDVRRQAQLDAGRLARPVCEGRLYEVERDDRGDLVALRSDPAAILRRGAALEDLVRQLRRDIRTLGRGTGG